ncbi:MAG: T9SS type A sorting domain-containing protein [Prolixibacteraceae bacterium]|nr:T9SS type A sorting domain-containing protein [Prolixibacteraceae bacterium]
MKRNSFIFSTALTYVLTMLLLSTSAQETDFSMNGYATVEGEGYLTTTGGEGGNETIVTTLEELEAFAKNREKNTTPEILYIKGIISADPTTVVTFKHGENLSIIGTDNGAELAGIGIKVWDYKNVVIRNLKIHEIFYPDDALSIEECQHVWIDHNELHSKIGAGIGVDTYDGLLDIKKGSRYVTVSWNYLHDHMKCMLIGHTDNASQGEEDQSMRVTIHHNIFENTNGRNPSLRWGAAHIYNNLYNNIDDYAIALRQGAHGLIENNLFQNVNIPVSTNKFDGEGFACMSGNIYSGTTLENKNSITQTGCEFWDSLPYAYTLEEVSALEALLREYTGTGKIESKITNSLNQVAFGNSFSVFPNPASGEFMIAFDATEGEFYSLNIINHQGKKIYLKSIMPFSTGKTQWLINPGNDRHGIHFVQLTGPQGTDTRKILLF